MNLGINVRKSLSSKLEFCRYYISVILVKTVLLKIRIRRSALMHIYRHFE